MRNDSQRTSLYIYSCTSIDGTRRCKVGISFNHKRRSFAHYGIGPLSFVAEYPMPSRDDAFALETLVCRTFPAFLKREMLDATPEAVRCFVENQLARTEVA